MCQAVVCFSQETTKSKKGFLFSKETVVLRRRESETKIGFNKRVDKGRITTVKGLKS